MGVSAFFERLGISPGIGFFLVLVLVVHIVVIAVLCVRTRLKADKWKLRKKRLQFKKSQHGD
jgi:hypothetical protein